MDKPLDKINKERHSFYKRMGREKQQLFIFLFMVLRQFKTNKTDQNFAMIRSVIDTLIKQNKNILQNLNCIANFEPNWATD